MIEAEVWRSVQERIAHEMPEKRLNPLFQNLQTKHYNYDLARLVDPKRPQVSVC